MTTESVDATGTVAASDRPDRAPSTTLPPPRDARRGVRARGRTTTGTLALGPPAADGLALVGALVAVTAPARPGVALAALGPGLLCLVALNAQGGLYRAAPAQSAVDELPALLARAALVWAAAAAVLAAVDPAAALGLTALLAALAVHTTLACGGRAVVYLLRRRSARRHPRSTLVVGLGPVCTRLTALLHAHPEYGMRPVGLADVPGGQRDADQPQLPVLTAAEDITRAVIQNSVRDAVLTRDPAGDRELAALARHLGSLGCTVWWVADDRQPEHRPLVSRSAGHLWGFGCRQLLPVPRPPLTGHLKRALDVVAAALGLLLVAPVLLLCALAVRLSDGPGILFRQERVGQGGEPFVLLKFRTLRPTDAYESATRWSVADDHRMSTVGRWLRRSSLDELPQLWNVLRGDMSLVGPRPERPYFVAQFSRRHPHYAARHRMPVGITGLAQVHGLRGDTSIEDRARFDNHYIDTWSLWQDTRILVRTVTSLVKPGGS